MKFLILFCALSIESVYACPDFAGLYHGACQGQFMGGDPGNLSIYIQQIDCNTYSVNDLTQKYFTVGKSSFYTLNGSPIVRRAFLNGNVLELHSTGIVRRKRNDPASDIVNSNTDIITKIDDDTISLSAEDIDVKSGLVNGNYTCPTLKKDSK